MEIIIVSHGPICILIRNIKAVLSKNPYVTVRGAVVVKDNKNNLSGKIEIFKDQADGMFSSWMGKKKEVLKNKVEVKLMRINNGKEEVFEEGDGLWTRYLRFNKKIYWQVCEVGTFFTEETEVNCLPSSSVHRKEIELIREEKFSEADRLIEKVEVVENQDSYNRKKFAKTLKKK